MSNSKINQTFGGQPANGNVYNNQSNGLNLEHFLEKTPMTQESDDYESDTEVEKTKDIFQFDHDDLFEKQTERFFHFGQEDTSPNTKEKEYDTNPENKSNKHNGHEYEEDILNTKPKAKEKIFNSYKDKIIPESLKKPYQDPRLSSISSVVTPMQTRNHNGPSFQKTSIHPEKEKSTVQGQPTSLFNSPHENINLEDYTGNGIQDNNSSEFPKKSTDFAPKLTNAKFTQNASSLDPTVNKNETTRILFNLKFKPTKLYHSPYLDNTFKPSPDKINLNSELEPLLPLIMSQHEVFEQHIKDLSDIYLTLTRIIEKKKESFHLLKANKKIPRSLRIKCELTTSPSYANHHNFIQLKEELQNEVSNFIENSSKIMERWAEINIQLLTNDRCTNILKKALQILEGLASFYADIIGQPYWPSISRKNTTLFLLKIYLSNNYIDTEDLSDHFGLPLEEVLNLGAKIIHDTATDSEINLIVSNLNISEFNTTDNLQKEFVSEVLVNFNQIIKICTIDIWHFYKEKTRQTTAANNLKLKMKAIGNSTATVATALAISKATDTINLAQSADVKTNLRLSNLEKSFRKQESATNEIRNKIKRTPQKNYSGSRIQEPTASPDIQALTNKKLKQKQKFVDLTIDPSQEDIVEIPTQKESPVRKQKRRRLSPQRKKVQWGSVDVHNFNTGHPATTPKTKHFSYPTPSMTLPFGQPPTFTPAPQPFMIASHYQTQPTTQLNHQFNQAFGTPVHQGYFQNLTQPFTQMHNPFSTTQTQQPQLKRSREFPFGK
jgi:hypothetical protein